MKKYQNSFLCYGQSVAGRIAYCEKMGVANGIINNIKRRMKNEGLDLKDWKYSFDIGNGKTLETMKITVVIPTQEGDWLDGKCPTFYYDNKLGLIDMLCFNDELQFHIMLYDRETKSYKNGYWHTVRECLTLEQTCTLFEYIDDCLNDLIILSLEDSDKYNSTGALGVSAE